MLLAFILACLSGCSNTLKEAHFGKHVPLHPSLEAAIPPSGESAAPFRKPSPEVKTKHYALRTTEDFEVIKKFYDENLENVGETSSGEHSARYEIKPPEAKRNERLFVVLNRPGKGCNVTVYEEVRPPGK